MNIKPLADRVLILPAPAEEKTIGVTVPATIAPMNFSYTVTSY